MVGVVIVCDAQVLHALVVSHSSGLRSPPEGDDVQHFRVASSIGH